MLHNTPTNVHRKDAHIGVPRSILWMLHFKNSHDKLILIIHTQGIPPFDYSHNTQKTGTTLV